MEPTNESRLLSLPDIIRCRLHMVNVFVTTLMITIGFTQCSYIVCISHLSLLVGWGEEERDNPDHLYQTTMTQ